MKKYFIENGYATEFANAKYILSPNIIDMVYKGMLGEVAGLVLIKIFKCRIR